MVKCRVTGFDAFRYCVNLDSVIIKRIPNITILGYEAFMDVILILVSMYLIIVLFTMCI